MSFVVCLTGGIASGKTLVSNKMADAGLGVIDADLVARDVVRKGSVVLKKLVEVFGDGILNVSGDLNRAELKQLAFNDTVKLQQMNQIIHPAIHNNILKQLKQIHCAVVLIVIPLFEPRMLGLYPINRVLTVDVKEEVQINRVLARDGVDYELALKIINAQMSRQERLLVSDDVMVNNGHIDSLYVKVNQMMCLYHNCASNQSVCEGN